MAIDSVYARDGQNLCIRGKKLECSMMPFPLDSRAGKNARETFISIHFGD
jgi:hypothetical protein